MNRLICAACGASYPLDALRWECGCGGLLDIEFEARIDPGAVAGRGPTMWRYREAVPVRPETSAVTLGEGMTPLREYTVAGRKVLVKEEYVNPTGSFKDRGASVLATVMRERGVTEAVEDSSGNAGAAVAAYCREAGVKCTVYVPGSVRAGKAELIRGYGARLKKVRGTREDCAREALEAAGKAYYAGHSRNPFFLHGTKTMAYEIAEQLGWKAPDAVVLPVGNGTLLLGAYIGFKDMLAAGLVDRMPRLIAVQARACAPLYHAFRHGPGSDGRLAGGAELWDVGGGAMRDETGGSADATSNGDVPCGEGDRPAAVFGDPLNGAVRHGEETAGGGKGPRSEPGGTMADGIAVASPARGSQVLAAVRQTGGYLFAVDELEIAAAMRDVSAKGFQIEPTAAAGIAGLARYLARGEPAEIVVTAFTGHNAPRALY